MAEVSDEERKLWEAALRSLTATRRVIWDFADKPEFSLNNDSLEHGARLWGNLLGLAEANAFLEQNNREVTTLEDGSEAIVADARDYEVAYRLFEATSKRSMENISDVHRKILDAVHKLQAGHTLGGWSMNKIAREAHVSSATVHRHKTFLTKSLGYLAEDEDGGLRLALGVDPSWWEKGEAMRGFPTPEEVQSWEGDTPPPESEILRNSETESQNPDTYAEKPVSQERNGSETSETAGSVVYAGKGGPGYDIYIGDREKRGGHDLPQSPWYNPFKIDKPGKKRDGTRKEVCIKYINYLNGPVENYKGRVFDGSHLLDRLMETDGQELDGKVLGCWCAGKDGAPEVLMATEPLPVHCHGQILLQAVRNIKRMAEAESPNGKVEPPAGVNVDSVGVEYETLDDEVEVF